MPRDLYRVLQVDPSADADVLEAAYRRLARKYHPDVSSAPDAEARMRELNDAYATLRDPVRRATYDRGRDEARRPEPSAPTATTARARPSRPREAPRPRASPPPPEPGARPPRAAPRPERPTPRPERPTPGPVPPPRRVVVRLAAPWERLADGLLANRYVLLAAASALLLAALLAALASRLFVLEEPGAGGTGVEVGATPAVVLVTRVPTAEPTPTARTTGGQAAPASWPPFVYVPVPVQAQPAATPEEAATAAAGP
jgi:hypothetical protein